PPQTRTYQPCAVGIPSSILIVLPSITSMGLAVGGMPTGLALTPLAATTKSESASRHRKFAHAPSREDLANHSRATPTPANRRHASAARENAFVRGGSAMLIAEAVPAIVIREIVNCS